MIQIDDRYLKDETTRNNSIVRYEVLAGIFINEYINNEVVLYVGTDPQKLLPDIHNKDNTIGFEVVRCEAKVDFVHDDVKKELVKIDYDYKKYLKIKNKNLDHVFNKVELELAVEKGRIRTTHVKDGAHDFDWIVDDYRETINKKLKKLNNGNYKNCSNISLIILNLDRAKEVLDAKQVKQCYFEEVQKFFVSFDYVYYITTNGIYIINTEKIEEFKPFCGDKFSDCVKIMKQKLKVDEYKNNL